MDMFLGDLSNVLDFITCNSYAKIPSKICVPVLSGSSVVATA